MSELGKNDPRAEKREGEQKKKNDPRKFPGTNDLIMKSYFIPNPPPPLNRRTTTLWSLLSPFTRWGDGVGGWGGEMGMEGRKGGGFFASALGQPDGGKGGEEEKKNALWMPPSFC